MLYDFIKHSLYVRAITNIAANAQHLITDFPEILLKKVKPSF